MTTRPVLYCSSGQASLLFRQDNEIFTRLFCVYNNIHHCCHYHTTTAQINGILVNMTVFDDRNNIPIDSSTLGTRMKRYRSELRISIPKLAKTLEADYGDLAISENVLTNIELGRKNEVSMDQIIEISHGLHITPLALICDLEQPFLSSENPVFGAMTKYGICQLFLSEMEYQGHESDNSVMTRIKEILETHKRYWHEVNKLTSNIFDLEAINSQGHLTDKDFEDGLDPTLSIYYAESSLREIPKIQEKLKELSVKVPDTETQNLKQTKLRLSKDKTKAITTGIVTASSLDELYEFENRPEPDSIWDNTSSF